VLSLDRDRRAAQTRFQELQQCCNDVPKRVGHAESYGEKFYETFSAACAGVPRPAKAIAAPSTAACRIFPLIQ